MYISTNNHAGGKMRSDWICGLHRYQNNVFLEIGRKSISANSHIYNYDHKIKLHMNFFLYIQHFLWISISSFIFITIITTSGILSIKSGHFHGFSWIFIDLTFYSRTTTWKIITNVKAKLFTFLMADLLVNHAFSI